MKQGRILFVTRYLPWPPSGGEKLRTFNNLRALSDYFDIDVVSVGEPVPEITDLCDRFVVASKYYGEENMLTAIGRWSRACISSVTTGQPLWLTSKVSGSLVRAVRSQLQVADYDAIHACELCVAAILPEINTPPIVYDSHNCEWKLVAKRMKQEAYPLSRVLAREMSLVKDLEVKALRRASLTFATSEVDRDDIVETSGIRELNVLVAPNSIDVERYRTIREHASEPYSVLVPGNFSWRLNVMGLEWFVHQVLPKLRQNLAEPALQVIVAGRMHAPLIRTLADVPGLTVVPNPPTDIMMNCFAKATAILVPVLYSSGTRLRILESFACRRAVVTTTPGALGLEGEDRRHWLLADSPDAFADAASEILMDTALRKDIVGAAWELVREYDWRTVQRTLVKGYQQLLDMKQTQSHL